MIGISGSLIWSKSLMELIFNHCVVNFGEVWRTQLAIYTLLTSTLGASDIFKDLLKSVRILKREWGTESNEKLPHLFMPSKIATWFLSLRWKTDFGQNCSLGA